MYKALWFRHRYSGGMKVRDCQPACRLYMLQRSYCPIWRFCLAEDNSFGPEAGGGQGFFRNLREVGIVKKDFRAAVVNEQGLFHWRKGEN